jgi:hypothetical protein
MRISAAPIRAIAAGVAADGAASRLRYMAAEVQRDADAQKSESARAWFACHGYTSRTATD